MANETENERKKSARNAAEVAVNGYLGGVGSHPSLKGLRLVAPSLFGFGVAAAILFDIDEYADAKSIQDFSIEGAGTAGGMALLQISILVKNDGWSGRRLPGSLTIF